LDWTYWNDSLAITIADINAPWIFCAGIR
jgi:hypothetical protein